MEHILVNAIRATKLSLVVIMPAKVIATTNLASFQALINMVVNRDDSTKDWKM